MPRNDLEDVRAVLDVNVAPEVSDSDLFIHLDDAASEIGEQIPTDAPYTEQRLKRLEKYLTAHYLLTTRHREIEQLDVNDITINYAGGDERNDGEFRATSAGRMVISIDYENYLSPNRRTVRPTLRTGDTAS